MVATEAFLRGFALIRLAISDASDKESVAPVLTMPLGLPRLDTKGLYDTTELRQLLDDVERVDSRVRAGIQRFIPNRQGGYGRAGLCLPPYLYSQDTGDVNDAQLKFRPAASGYQGRAFDYDRFPIDKSSAVERWPGWKPGWPIDMPNVRNAKERARR